MRGVSHPVTVYTPCLDKDCLTMPVTRKTRAVGPSNAERVVLLQRGRPAELAR
jgi:hypothetical protein